MRFRRGLVGRAYLGVALAMVVACNRTGPARSPFPQTSDIRSMRATYRDGESKNPESFAVPEEHWGRILAAMAPAVEDDSPAKWAVLGGLEIDTKDGKHLSVSTYWVGSGPGAFSAGPTWQDRTYYRGGRSDELIRALKRARDAANPGEPPDPPSARTPGDQ